MILRLAVVAGVVLVAAVAAVILQRRRPSAPTNPSAYVAPAQLDRDDFDEPGSPWLVAVFTSATCQSCGDVWGKASLLRSDDVAAMNVEVGDRPELHHRYGIEAVPITVLADAAGVVRRSFVGPVSSTHLWGAMAELRSPGSVPENCGAARDADALDHADPQPGVPPNPL